MAYIFSHANDTHLRLAIKIVALVVFYPFVALVFGTFLCIAQLSEFIDRYKAVD